MWVDVLSQVTRNRTIGNGLQLLQERFRLDFTKKILHQKGHEALEKIAQGNC